MIFGHAENFSKLQMKVSASSRRELQRQEDRRRQSGSTAGVTQSNIPHSSPDPSPNTSLLPITQVYVWATKWARQDLS